MTLRLLFVLALCALPGVLSATTAARLDLDALTDHAEVVAQGKISGKEARWDDAHTGIWTHYSVDVSDVARGDTRNSLEFVVRGGVVGKVGQSVSGSGSFSKGDELVVFLAKDESKRLQLVGMVQGAFSVSETGGKKRAKSSSAGLTLVDAKTLRMLSKEERQPLEYELSDLLKNVRERVKAHAEAEQAAREAEAKKADPTNADAKKPDAKKDDQ